jgi:4-amino-4-deoxy-L-arabinose transferase-like glycosyltransferase
MRFAGLAVTGRLESFSGAITRRGTLFYRFSVVLVLAAYLGICLWEIGNYWQWGHNGYNGAAFSQAARNSIRFGILGQAQYYTGINPPGPDAIYTRHPMMLHFHLIAAYWLLGYHEWAGRLVPALYSFLGLVLIFTMLRRLCGRAEALIGIVIYVLTPINLIFANMIDHEQGCIFWCLVLIYSYILWLRSYRWRFFALSMAAAAMAVQFDWPGYYMAFFIALHAFATGIARHPRWYKWKPEYTWVTTFSCVILANFFCFFWWITRIHGNLEQMKESFDSRAEQVSGYWHVIFHHALDLQGAVGLVLLLAWLMSFIPRLLLRCTSKVELVPALFLVMQAIHSTVFKNAGFIHSYWTYYLSPAMAVGGAVALVTFEKSSRILVRDILCRRLRPASTRGVSLGFKVIAFGVAAALLVHGGRLAWAKFKWGFTTGSASYNDNYYDQFKEVTWAKELARLYGREGVVYKLDKSLSEWRIELMYYLDAPYDELGGTGFDQAAKGSKKHVVVLVDLKQTGARKVIAQMPSKGKMLVWNRRFVAMEPGTAERGLKGFVSYAQPSPWWWRWLVNFSKPPVTWVPDQDRRKLGGALGLGVQVTAEIIKGGGGGGLEEWDCPPAWVIGGFSVAITKTKSQGDLLGALRPFCRRVDREGKLAAEAEEPGTWMGSLSGPKIDTIACRDGDFPVGAYMYVHAGRWISGMGMVCASGRLETKKGTAGWIFKPQSTYRTTLAGRKSGKVIEALCPAGSVVWGFRGRAGALVDAAGVSCAEFNRDFESTDMEEARSAPGKDK